jgi:hypothetical protein
MMNETTKEKRMTKKQQRAEHRARMDAIHAETQAVVDTGVCPDCGSGLRRNLSITGWWQCEQYGAVGFRKDDNRPACDWQGFTA